MYLARSIPFVLLNCEECNREPNENCLPRCLKPTRTINLKLGQDDLINVKRTKDKILVSNKYTLFNSSSFSHSEYGSLTVKILDIKVPTECKQASRV